VYRRALGLQQAIAELQNNAGTQFDPQVVDMMLRLVMGGVFDQVRAQYGRAVEQLIPSPPPPAAEEAAPAAAAPQPEMPPPPPPPGQPPLDPGQAA
jgi:hypothetical protein